MSRYFSYLNSAHAIIKEYDGQYPLAVVLKNIFSQNKKYGSKDRKFIAQLCYDYYRFAILIGTKPSLEQQIISAHYLSNQANLAILETLAPKLANSATASFEEKCSILGLNNNEWQFIFLNLISPKAINWVNNFYKQPHLFIRIRPHFISNFKKHLLELSPIKIYSDTLVAFPNRWTAENFFNVGKDVIIQDYASQKVMETICGLVDFNKKSIWDCCAASGGKSIFIKDNFKNANLHVSDLRASILQNLKKRFEQAQISNYNSFVADATNYNPKHQFDIVLADVPCTGSGTWARTPEQAYFFEQKILDNLIILQTKIIENTLKSVKKGGYFIYITCSIFELENEKQVLQIEQKGDFELVKTEYILGYEQGGDSMFYAIFKKL